MTTYQNINTGNVGNVGKVLTAIKLRGGGGGLNGPFYYWECHAFN